MRMHKILTIAKRDYVATVRTKAFLFGLVIAPLLFGGGSIAATLMKSKPDLRERRIALVDRSGAVAEAIVRAAREKNEKELLDKKTGQQATARVVFEVLEPAADSQAQLLSLSDRVRRRELAAFIDVGARVLEPAGPADEAGAGGGDGTAGLRGVSYYSNGTGIEEAAGTRNWMSGPVNDGVRWARLVRAGMEPGRVKDLIASVQVTRLGLLERDAKTGRILGAQKRGEMEGFLVPFGVAMILAMIVMVGAAPMLQNVTQDKSQRVVEMLLGSASPFELMAGRVLGAVGVSLTSSLLYVAGGILAVNALGIAGMLPLSILPWFYVYLLADVVMLCSFAAALGAACSSPQDAQNLAVVLLAPCIVPILMLVNVMRQPNGLMATALSLFPPFTPILMLLRQTMPNGVPAWQPWAGVAGVAAFTLATVWVASRIFRVAILMHGKPPRLADLARWAVRG